MFTIHLNNEHILFDYKIKGRHILPSSILLVSYMMFNFDQMINSNIFEMSSFTCGNHL